MAAPHRRPAVLWGGTVIVLLALRRCQPGRWRSVSRACRRFAGAPRHRDPLAVTIVRELRLPRVLLALLVGCALGSAGAALQGTLRNALAEPYLLGVSGGAAVGAVLAMTFGIADPVALPLAAFGGAIAAVLLVLGLARSTGSARDPRTLLTAGVIIGALANAVIIVALADAPPDRVRGALWWMAGSVSDASMAARRMALGLRGARCRVARGARPVARRAGARRGISGSAWCRCGSRHASGVLVSALLAAASVSAAGLIGFVGLVVPNIARAFGIVRHRALILTSALTGAALVICADLIARTVRAPIELPLGAITA